MSDVAIRGKARAELFRFGPDHRRLFGTFHSAAARASRGILLCPPFGQEAIRLHRLFRVLGDRLSRVGIATLRFDYFGTGDADGDDHDGDLDGWALDIMAAHRELIARTPATPITWVGAGLGASLAASAAPGASPARLVLWDPVLEGRPYLDDLRSKHVDTLEASFGLADPSWRRALVEDAAAFTDEAMGFAIPSRLRAGIANLTSGTLGHEVTCDVDVIADSGNAIARDWAGSLRQARRTTFHSLDSDFEWTAEELRGAALVPPQALKLLLALCAET